MQAPPTATPVPVTQTDSQTTQLNTMAAALVGGGTGGFGAQSSIDTLMQAGGPQEVQAPPDATQDKISFVLNNMSPTNVPAKSEELRQIIEEAECVPWFAHYLVVKRVSLEPNFHGIYATMVECLAMKPLNNAILQATLSNARVLISSGKIRSSSSERSLLKNLGAWLGLITLARNKPLLLRDLDMKELICDAYERGLLIAVVPFVAKILDAASASRVFMPPNPWVMGIMMVLVELYQVPDLKLNLKFEIEVLAKTLKVELTEVMSSKRLAMRTQDRTQTCDFANRAGALAAGLGGGLTSGFGGGLGSGSMMGVGGGTFAAGGAGGMGIPGCGACDASAPPFGAQMSAGQLGSFGQAPPPPPPPPGSQGAAMQQLLAQQQQQQQQVAAAAQAAQQAQAAQAAAQQLGSLTGAAAAAGDDQTVIPNLATYVHINGGLQLFAAQPQLKRVVPVAIDRAIRDIITPVVERSVTISCVTTRELMLKDFAMEPDETRMRKAAQLMVQNLAGSLALVTCKEPLRVACGNHLRSLLQQAGADAQLMEQVVQVCAADNLDLGCTLIEKAATEKAVRDVEEALAPAFAIRRKHREQTGLPYYDMSIFTNGRYPASLPEALRPKPGGLLPAQRRVYEDFGRIPRTAAAMGIVPGQTPGATGVAGAAGVAGQPATGAANPLFAQQAGAGGAYGAAGTQAAQALLGQTGASPARVGGIPGCGSADGLAGMAAAMGGAQLPSGFGGGSTGQLPGVGAAAGAVSGDGAQLSTAQVIDKASITVAKLDMLVQQLAAQGVTSIATLAADDNLHGLLAQISAVVASSVSRDETALALVNKIFKRAFEQNSSANGAAARLHTQVNVQLICRIHAVCPKVARFVTEMTLYSDAERKLNREIMFPLIQAGMVQPAEFTAHLAKHLDGGRNGAAVAFSMALVRTLVLDERAVAADACGDLLSALSQLAKHPSPPEGLLRLLDDARMSLNAPGAAAAVGGGARRRRRRSRTRRWRG